MNEYFDTREQAKRNESARTEKMIDHIIERAVQMKKKGIELRSSKNQDGVFKFVANKEIPFPYWLAAATTAFARKKVAPNGGWGRGDCRVVALEGQSNIVDARIKKRGTIYGEYPSQEQHSQLFSYHALNYVLVDEGNDPLHVAFDLTARYNVDGEQGRYDVIAFAARSKDELRRMLETLYEFKISKKFKSDIELRDH